MICKGCFTCQLWGEMAALTVGLALILAVTMLFFT